MKLQVKNVNKSFGTKQVLTDVSFDVTSGKAMGFLGRNGAGKTTTFRALMDVFKPDSGEFLIDGQPFSRHDYRVGYLPEERGMYAKVSIVDQLAYFGQLKQMSHSEAKQAAQYWVHRLELAEYEKKTLDHLSKGNQQKIQIAQAVISDPEILILDEPFSGLDPVNAQVLKELIREYIDAGKIVVFSSHEMTYVEEFCDEITLIDQGSIVLSEDLNALKRKLGKNRVRINLLDTSIEQAMEQLAVLEGVSLMKDRRSVIAHIHDEQPAEFVLKQLVAQDFRISEFSYYKPSLEQIFIQTVGESHA